MIWQILKRSFSSHIVVVDGVVYVDDVDE